MITKREWLGLTHDQRYKLIQTFHIRKTEPTSVVNNVIVSDGTSNKDLEVLNIHSMGAFVKEALPWYHEDLDREILAIVLRKLDGESVAPQVEFVQEETTASESPVLEVHIPNPVPNEIPESPKAEESSSTGSPASDIGSVAKRKGRPPKQKKDL